MHAENCLIASLVAGDYTTISISSLVSLTNVNSAALWHKVWYTLTMAWRKLCTAQELREKLKQALREASKLLSRTPNTWTEKEDDNFKDKVINLCTNLRTNMSQFAWRKQLMHTKLQQIAILCSTHPLCDVSLQAIDGAQFLICII